VISGDDDFLISTHKNEQATIKINEDCLDGMNLRLYYNKGSYYLVGDNEKFVNSYETPSAYYQMFKDEKY
jgi:hypothetical protein